MKNNSNILHIYFRIYILAILLYLPLFQHCIAQCSFLDTQKGATEEFVAFQSYDKLLKLLQSKISPLERQLLDDECKAIFDSTITDALSKMNVLYENYGLPKSLDNFYYVFYKGTKLSYKAGKYSYVGDTNEKIHKLGDWDMALPFTLDGFARVQRIEGDVIKDVLIDIEGNVFNLASKVSEIGEQTDGLLLSRIPSVKSLNETQRAKIRAILIDQASPLNIIDFISRFENLEFLSITNCRLDSFSFEEAQLSNLKFLNLRNNKLDKVPEGIATLKKLVFLDLSNNNLSQLSLNITQLNALEVLLINSKSYYAENITSLPIGFDNLSKLRILQLNGNKIGKSITKIANLKELEVLTLRHCVLDSNLIDFGQLINLQVLDLSNNNLKKIPIERVSKGNSLACLFLEYNKISDIENAVYQLHKLRFLSLKVNRIQSISDSISFLNQLVFLNLSENKVDKFPPQIIDLKHLKFLNINRNKFRSFPIQICALTTLRTLDVGKNTIKDVPACITKLKKLKSLLFSETGLTEIPTSILELANLEALLVSYNPIKTLPSDITVMSNLKVFACGSCQLEEIPQPLFNLDNLVILYLTANKLNKFPDHLNRMKKLRKLNLEYNQLTEDEEKRIRSAIMAVD